MHGSETPPGAPVAEAAGSAADRAASAAARRRGRAKAINRVLAVLLVALLVVFWAFSRTIRDEFGPAFLAYGLWGVCIGSALIEILPNAMSPPSLIVVCQSVGLGLAPSITFMTLGSLAGGLIGFQIGRRYGSGLARVFVEERLYRQAESLVGKRGGIALLICAISPLPDYPIVFGSFGMTWRDYLTYGFIPRAAAFTLMGYLFALAGRALF